MMQFLSNYWMLLLIFFILTLILILEYMLSQEKKRISRIEQKYEKEIDNMDLERKMIDNYSGNKLNGDNSAGEADFKVKTNEALNNDSLEVKLKNEERFTKVDMSFDEFEKELSKLDLEFDKVVSKKSVLDKNLIASIDEMKVEPLVLSKYDKDEEEIVLPDIKLD